MPTTGAVTANEITVTLQAQTSFSDAVQSLNTIGGNVYESAQSLANSAMVTTAGDAFAKAMSTWCEDFNDIYKMLNTMAEQLGTTATALQAGNQQSADMAVTIL
jgi:flagellar hook-associated protein FlgK